MQLLELMNLLMYLVLIQLPIKETKASMIIYMKKAISSQLLHMHFKI